MSIFGGVADTGSLVKKARSWPMESEKAKSMRKEVLDEIDEILSSLSLQSKPPRGGGKAKRSDSEGGNDLKKARTNQYYAPSGEMRLPAPALLLNPPVAESSGKKRARTNQYQPPSGEIRVSPRAALLNAAPLAISHNPDDKGKEEEDAPAPIAILPVVNEFKRPVDFEGMVWGRDPKRPRTVSYQSNAALLAISHHSDDKEKEEEVAPAPIATSPVENKFKRPVDFEGIVWGRDEKRARAASYQSPENEIHFGFPKC